MDDKRKKQFARKGKRIPSDQPSSPDIELIRMLNKETRSGEEKSPGLKEEHGPDDEIIEGETYFSHFSPLQFELSLTSTLMKPSHGNIRSETGYSGKKDYRIHRNLYDTTYKEIDFSCNKEESSLYFIINAFGERISSKHRTYKEEDISANTTTYRSCVFNELDIRRNIESYPSYSIDAFGEVKFVGYGDEVAKFSHVNVEDSICETIFKMRVQWKLSLPKLLISVTGGRSKFQLNSHLNKALECGLVKAARTTDAWILTAGLHAGVAKYIGKAIHDNECSSTGNKVVTIGIASWKSVQNKESLDNCKGRRRPAEYVITNETDTETCALDPYHSHFILVDNCKNAHAEILLRKKLQRAFLHDKIRETEVKIPSIVIMIEGGPGTLTSVFDSLSRDIPVIIVKGSGRAADIMAYAYQRVIEIVGGENNIALDGNQKEQLKIDMKEKCKREFGKNLVINDRDLVEQMLDSLEKNLITLFDIDSAEDFVVTILKALFKVNKDDFRNLRLALEWNRFDIAKSEILQKDTSFLTDRWHELMILALRQNRIEFVKYFLKHGVVTLREFLTEEHIKNLYNMEEIRIYIDSQRICPTQISSKMILKTKTDILPRATQLLKWAVLFNREKVIFQFWKVCLGALPTALVVNKLLKLMHEECKDYGYKLQLQKQAKLYEERATDVLTECYSADVQKTIDVLLLKRNMWDEDSCMQIAFKVNNETFMSHEACQSLLTKIWMGNISEKTNFWKLILCALCPLFMFLIKFDEEQHDRKNTNNSNYSKQHGQYYYRCLSFYNSPRIKFLGNLIFYIIFLVIYSYVLVVEHQNQFSNLEWLLFVWVIAIFTEEIRQMLSQKSSSLKSKFLTYMRDVWNIVDVITIILYITGTTFRFLKLYEAAKVILSINLISFYIRFLYMLSVHKELGPKLIMIKKMMQDLGYFIIILFVFMIAYGVASQSILYSSSPISYNLFKAVFRKAYFHMYAELFLEEYEEHSNCNGNSGTCPSEISTYIVLILMCLYILLTNILLLNLLIAMFSYTFQQVQEKSQFHWCFQRYNLISEFYTRSPLPPPFILLSHIYQFCRYMCLKARHVKPKNEFAFAKDFEDSYKSELIIWERKVVKIYLSRKNKSDCNLKDVIDQLSLKVDESKHKIDNMDKTLTLLTEKLLNTVET